MVPSPAPWCSMTLNEVSSGYAIIFRTCGNDIASENLRARRNHMNHLIQPHSFTDEEFPRGFEGLAPVPGQQWKLKPLFCRVLKPYTVLSARVGHSFNHSLRIQDFSNHFLNCLYFHSNSNVTQSFSTKLMLWLSPTAISERTQDRGK